MSATEVDCVIVGGAAAGCVLAARLRENPAQRVLLAEAGPDHLRLIMRVPAGVAGLYRRGLDGLRIADNSIMPVVANGNTHVPAIMIGDKA